MIFLTRRITQYDSVDNYLRDTLFKITFFILNKNMIFITKWSIHLSWVISSKIIFFFFFFYYDLTILLKLNEQCMGHSKTARILLYKTEKKNLS